MTLTRGTMLLSSLLILGILGELIRSEIVIRSMQENSEMLTAQTLCLRLQLIAIAQRVAVWHCGWSNKNCKIATVNLQAMYNDQPAVVQVTLLPDTVGYQCTVCIIKDSVYAHSQLTCRITPEVPSHCTNYYFSTIVSDGI